VRVTGSDGVTSAWSDPVTLRSVFLGEGEWQARFVGLAQPKGDACPGLIRTEIDVSKPVASATV
jgi:alpha-L-rhamnosidase